MHADQNLPVVGKNSRREFIEWMRSNRFMESVRSLGNMLILGATVVLPDSTRLADVRISEGIIDAITEPQQLQPLDNELLINGSGFHLLPGAIDPQVHFRDPGQPEREDLESGSAAAVSGGVTSFLDMPNNKPAITDMVGMQMKLDMAAAKCVNNYGFFIGATPENVEDLQEVVGTPDAPLSIPGICGIKIFMGSSTGTLLVNELASWEMIFSTTGGRNAVH